MLIDNYLSMSYKTMEDTMIICFNAKVWTEQEKEEILRNAMKKYLRRLLVKSWSLFFFLSDLCYAVIIIILEKKIIQ